MSKLTLSLLAFGAVGAAGVYVGKTQRAPFQPIVAAQAKPAPARAQTGTGADAAHPVVLELYQSQGCSSCPPANAVLNEIASRPEILALNFSVTYWDQLGWKDSFAKPAFTARQWDYSRAQGRSNVQTPQLIVNGKGAVLGSRKGEVEQAIATYTRGNSGPALSATDGTIDVAAAKTNKPATVWLVGYDPRTIEVPIRAGENGGRTLPHRNIVKQLVPLGNWTGSAARFTAPATRQGLRRAVIVQSGTGGPIVAAARI